MALATRCPQCGTAFRLVADQLRLHDGLVRCGACSAIFDGRQNQFEVDPTAPPGAIDVPLVAPAPPAPPPALATIPPPVSPMTPTFVDAPPPAPVSPPIPERLPERLPEPAAAPAPAEPVVERAPAPDAQPETLVEPADPALLGPATRLVLPPTPPAPTPPTPFRAPGESGIRELGAGGAGIRPIAPRGATPPIAPRGRIAQAEEPRVESAPGEPALRGVDIPDVGIDDARAHGPGAREPSLHEPLPLAPSGDASLLHAPQTFGAREVPDAAAENRREPRFVDPAIPPVVPAGPREPVVSRVRASVIDDGMPTPRLRSRADGTIPDLRARLRADAEAEAAEALQVPELRRESADPSEPVVPEVPRNAPAEPIYAWDPTTEDTEAPEPVVDDAPVSSILDEPDESRPPRRIWPWVLGILVAALALGGQALWVWRDEIATNFPVTRPMLTAMCAPLGCTVGYPRHPELLSIESSALEPWQNDANATEPGNATNRLALRVVLRNRHTLPQPWPSIELTLTDLSDNAVVRRVLSPSDYLPADTVSKPMPARSERSLRVPVDPPAEAVSGYRLSVFFP